MQDIIYTKYSIDRDDKYKIRTDIIVNDRGERSVRKSALTAEAQAHIENIYRVYEGLCECYGDTGIKINTCRLVDGAAEFPFICGKTFEELLDEKLETEGVQTVIQYLKKYCEFVKHGAHRGFDKTEAFVKVFGDIDFGEDTECVNAANVDLIFSNIIINEYWNIIDYEWSFLFDVPVNYIIYRAVSGYVNGMFDASSREEIKKLDILCLTGITPEELEKFKVMDDNFSGYVIGDALTGRELQTLIGKPVIDTKTGAKEFLDKLNDKAIQIFYDMGDGFNDGDCKFIMPHWDNDNILRETVLIPPGCKSVRIDPMIGYGFLKLNAIQLDNAEAEYEANGITFDNNVIAFYNDDPQIVLKDTLGKAEIHIEGEICFSNQDIIDGIRTENDNLNRRIDGLYADMAAINSQKDDFAGQIVSLNKKIVLLEDDISKKNNHIDNLQICLYQMNEEKNALADKCAVMEYELNQNIIKRLLKSNRFTLKLGRFLKSLIKNGPVTTFKIVYVKVRRRLTKKYYKEKVVLNHASAELGYNVKALTDLPEAQTMHQSVAVHLHLFYTDLLPEFVWYLNNMPYPFDLFISCQIDGPVDKIRKTVKGIKNVNRIVIRECQNRGRDIAPLYVWFREEIEKYDYFLHMHSKKSLYTGTEKTGWRQMSLDSLLGSEEIVRKIFGLMGQDSKVGLVYPEYYSDFCKFHCSWLTNDIIGREFLDGIGLEQESMMFHYPAGSFFWAKTDAVRTLFDIGLNIEDFPEEKGQTDTTLAHVLERAIACVAESRGYAGALIDLEEGVVRVRRSLKLFRDYMNYSAADVIDELKIYDIISFDIFGTLLTSKLCNKSDLYKYMQSFYPDIISESYDFEANRKRAEKEAIKKYGDSVRLSDIYQCLSERLGLDSGKADEIMELEEKCLADLTIPRADMHHIYESMVYRDKQIVLVEDTYYSRSLIESIMHKCGYEVYNDLWLSCEIGKRKDKDELWDAFYDKYNQGNIVHVGDNPRADWQTVYDRGRQAFWVMNGYDEFVMSKYFEEYGHLLNGTIEDLLKLGEIVNEKYFNSPFALKGPEGNEVKE